MDPPDHESQQQQLEHFAQHGPGSQPQAHWHFGSSQQQDVSLRAGTVVDMGHS